MLTSTPSRSHRSKARSVAISLVVVVVLAVLAGAGYAVTRGGDDPTISSPSAALTTTASTAPPSAPATTAAAPDVVPFVALPIGSPPTAGTSDTHYPWYRLTATLSGPHSASVGDTVAFTVRLTNPTSAAIALDPCPAFDLTVGYQTMSYGLNCAGAPDTVIAPGASLSFALPVPVPHSLATGASTDVAWSLGWQPDGHSPHAHQAVRISS